MRKIDITGKKIGLWIALQESKPGYWACRCECGDVVNVLKGNLLRGQSFGCLKCRGTRLINIENKKFGSWTVLKKDKSKKHQPYWICRCDCGRYVSVYGGNLRKGLSTKCNSCGFIRYPEGTAGFNRVYHEYKINALKRNHSWALSEQECKLLVENDCFYCGKDPNEIPISRKKTGKHTKNYNFNGIDRVDNKKGYTIDNCVTCCILCNRAKRELSREVFVAWIKRLRAAHLKVEAL